MKIKWSMFLYLPSMIQIMNHFSLFHKWTIIFLHRLLFYLGVSLRLEPRLSQSFWPTSLKSALQADPGLSPSPLAPSVCVKSFCLCQRLLGPVAGHRRFWRPGDSKCGRGQAVFRAVALGMLARIFLELVFAGQGRACRLKHDGKLPNDPFQKE